jgi:hypothetical protein
MTINGIEDFISAALRWVGIEDGDPRSDIAKALSKNDDFVSTFHVAERGLPEALPEVRHPIFDPRPSISSGDEGGGGSASAPGIRDGRDVAQGIDWDLVSRPEYQEYARAFFDGLTYADLRVALEVIPLVTGGVNPAGLLLRELEANLRRCTDPARRPGDPLFRLEVLMEGEFRRAVRQVYESQAAFHAYPAERDGGYSEYRDLLLRKDALVDALRALPSTGEWERREAYERAIRRLEARLPHPTPYRMRLEHLTEARLITPDHGEARLPRRGEATLFNVDSQIRAMLPEPLRGPRYDAFLRRATREIHRELESLSDAERDRLFREELARHGSILGGVAPESLVLSYLERQAGTSDFDAPSRELLRGRIAEIRSSRGNPVTRELAESFRRAGRLIER